MTKDEFMAINKLEREDILFMMATRDVDTALERWNLLCVTDENGEDCLEFDLEEAIDKLGNDVAQEMNNNIYAYFSKREFENQMNKDLAEGRIEIDEDGNIIDLTGGGAANEEL